MKSPYRSVVNVVKHIILKNGWEYFVTDDKHDEETVRCIVMGFEIEHGDVWLPEIKPYIISETTDLNEVMPVPGWQWVK